MDTNIHNFIETYGIIYTVMDIDLDNYMYVLIYMEVDRGMSKDRKTYSHMVMGVYMSMYIQI
jgi:hypothetical protein